MLNEGRPGFTGTFFFCALRARQRITHVPPGFAGAEHSHSTFNIQHLAFNIPQWGSEIPIARLPLIGVSRPLILDFGPVKKDFTAAPDFA